MSPAGGRFWRPVCVLAVIAAWAELSFLGATEKHWIAHEAQVIVVGTLDPSPTMLWFDGWYLSGVITVDEVLYGGRLPRQISFQWACRWKSLCQWWPPPRLPEIYSRKGLWFLRRSDQKSWGPSVGLGFLDLDDRAYWEMYIRQHKQ